MLYREAGWDYNRISVTYLAGYRCSPRPTSWAPGCSLRWLWQSQRGTIRRTAENWAPATVDLPNAVVGQWRDLPLSGFDDVRLAARRRRARRAAAGACTVPVSNGDMLDQDAHQVFAEFRYRVRRRRARRPAGHRPPRPGSRPRRAGSPGASRAPSSRSPATSTRRRPGRRVRRVGRRGHGPREPVARSGRVLWVELAAVDVYRGRSPDGAFCDCASPRRMRRSHDPHRCAGPDSDRLRPARRRPELLPELRKEMKSIVAAPSHRRSPRHGHPHGQPCLAHLVADQRPRPRQRQIHAVPGRGRRDREAAGVRAALHAAGGAAHPARRAGLRYRLGDDHQQGRDAARRPHRRAATVPSRPDHPPGRSATMGKRRHPIIHPADCRGRSGRGWSSLVDPMVG